MTETPLPVSDLKFVLQQVFLVTEALKYLVRDFGLTIWLDRLPEFERASG